MKYKPSDLVKVFKNTPTFIDGQICVVLDRDPEDDSLSVAPLEVTALEEYDTIRLLKNHAKWVKKEDVEKISFNRSKYKLKAPAAFFLGALFGFMTLGLISGF